VKVRGTKGKVVTRRVSEDDELVVCEEVEAANVETERVEDSKLLVLMVV
jgi:hypothetical protein